MTPISQTARTRRRMILAGLTFPFIPVRVRAQSVGRVITVGGMVTETVYALGMESALVATDTTSIFPPAANRLPKVGYQRALSAEGVLALKPELIIAAGEAGPPTAIAQLRAAKVAVHVLGTEHSVAGVRQRIGEIARLLGVDERGSRLAAEFRREWETSEREVQRYGARPRVLFVLAHTPNNTMVAGEGTAADAMIRLAGGANAMSGFSGYRPLNAEGAVAAKPEVVLITSQGLAAAGGAQAVWQKAGMAMTPAGRAQRLVHLDALYLLGFGPRLPAAVRELAVAIHRGAQAA